MDPNADTATLRVTLTGMRRELGNIARSLDVHNRVIVEMLDGLKRTLDDIHEELLTRNMSAHALAVSAETLNR